MALIEKQVIPPKKEQLTIRLDPGTIAMLERYAEFIESSLHYVIEESLAFTFRKDREFQEWLERTGAASSVKPTAVGSSAERSE